MMNVRLSLIATAAGLVLLLGACSMGLDGTSASNTAATPELPTEPSDPDNGLLHIAVPTVSQSLLDALDATYDPSGAMSTQALVFASTVDFTLQYPDGSGIADITWTQDVDPDYATIDEASGDAVTIVGHEVTPGTGLILEAEVYNTNVSSDTPVVVGQSAPFSVGPGSTTSVSITALPNNPIVFDTSGQTHTGSLAQMSFDATYVDPDVEFTLNGIGGEQWFKVVTPPSPADGTFARVRVQPTGTDAVLLPFNAAGQSGSDILGEAFGYDFYRSVFNYAIGGGHQLPTETVSGMIWPLFEVQDTQDGTGSYLADTENYAALIAPGLNDTTAAGYEIRYDVLDYSGVTRDPDLVDPTTANPVVLDLTTPYTSVLQPVFQDGTDPQDGDYAELYAEEHYLKLQADPDTMTTSGENDLEFQIEVDLADDLMNDELYRYDPTANLVDGSNQDYPSFGFYWEGQDGSVDPEAEYRFVFPPDSISITSGTESDTITLTYTVNYSSLPGLSGASDLVPGSEEFWFVVGSDWSGTRYTIVWGNNSPGIVDGTIQ